jgi:GDP-fucose transporter C1
MIFAAQFIQLAIAVVLLHIVSFISFTPFGSVIRGTVELPTLEFQIGMKLMPLVSVGIVALVFNTLCLRNVDASFFQVRSVALISRGTCT